MKQRDNHHIIYIAVNAVAAKHGGALTILNHFIALCLQQKRTGIRYCVFASIDIPVLENEFLEIINVGHQQAMRRLLWDYYFFRKSLTKRGIEPGLIISFQNTGVFFDRSVPQLIYLHQSLPFVTKTWKWYRKEERIYWFYRNIYPFFIRITLFSKSYLVVQAEWMKKRVAAKMKFPEHKIFVSSPVENVVAQEPAISLSDLSPKNEYFYPAIPALYKNHLLLVKIVDLFKKNEEKPGFNITLTCTLSDLDDASRKLIEEQNLYPYFTFAGHMTPAQVNQSYLTMLCLLFPSYIETVGLPLLEAAAKGKTIFVADEPFSREALSGYDNVVYLPFDQPEIWVAAMKEKNNFRITKTFKPAFSGWESFFSSIFSIVQKDNEIKK